MLDSRWHFRVHVRHVFALICLFVTFIVIFEWTSIHISYDMVLKTQPRPLQINSSQLEILSTHWIVVTTVAPPTADVMYMASLPGWKVVIVGDEKTPVNWSYPNCVYLSLTEQKTLGFRLTDRLPVRSYSRKNLGYLYAIRQGAKAIFDTDDDNRPLDNLLSFQTDPTSPGLVAMAHHDRPWTVFNPYPHFGQPTLWPRGYPLTEINGQRFNGTYRLFPKLKTPLIQQGVVKGDPDLDALFRLTRKGTAPSFDVTFDPVSPPVVLPAGTYSPINSQNTLFQYDAFWAMILPTTTAFRVCDIWRGYWAQRLLWEIGGNLGFPAVNAVQARNVHRYLEDAADETQVYFHTERLLAFLSNWSCPQELAFFKCVQRLSWDMARENHWGVEDAEIIRIWLKDLQYLGYLEPQRILGPSERCRNPKCVQKFMSNDCCSNVTSGALGNNSQSSNVYFFPVEQEAPSLAHLKPDIRSLTVRNLFQVLRICPRLTVESKHLLKPPIANNIFQDVLLIIIFHYPFYDNLNYTEAAYRIAFPNIAYCGPSVDIFQKHSQNISRNLTFIEAAVDRGKVGYICLLKAILAGFHVAGYLVIGDDVLINFWSFSKFNKDNIWTTKDRAKLLNMARAEHLIQWGWWTKPTGKTALNKAFSEISRSSIPPGITPPGKLTRMLLKNTGRAGTIFRSVSDIYYVPARLVPDITWYLGLFLKHRVFLEIAVPVVLYGLQRLDEIESIRGNSIWNKDRNHPWTFYNPGYHYLHPVKFSRKENQRGFCSLYIPVHLKHALGITFYPKDLAVSRMY